MKHSLLLVIVSIFCAFSHTSEAQITFADPTFSIGTGFNNIVYAMVKQSDNKIIVGGLFTSYNTVGRNRIARLQIDGALDTGFDVGTGFDGEVRCVVLQNDGKIVVGGDFNNFNGVARSKIARLNTDGTLDTSFNPNSGFNGLIYSIAIQADDKLVVGGAFGTFDGVVRTNLARLNSNGSLDTAFLGVSNNINGSVRSVIVQLDGTIIVGGEFTSYNSTTRNRIMKLTSSGSLETTFLNNTGFDDRVNIMALRSDGVILVGGNFTQYNGSSQIRMALLNSTGTGTMSNFYGAINNSVNGEVNSILIQNDNTIVLGGTFTSVTFTIANRIVRFSKTSQFGGYSFDSSFYQSDMGAFNSTVNALLMQGNKIIAGGSFTTMNTTTQNRITRLIVGLPKPVTPTSSNVTTTSFDVNWTAVSEATSYRLDVSVDSDFSTFLTGYDNLTVNGTSTSLSGLLSNTYYYARVRATNAVATSVNSNTLTVRTVPSPPVATAATNISTTGFTANWQAVANVGLYRIDLSTDNFVTFVSGYNGLQIINGVTSRVITGLTPNVTYYYRVRSEGTGFSVNSNVIQVTTPLPAPTATAATDITATGFTANWNAVTNAQGYQIDVSSDNFITFVTGYEAKVVTGTSASVVGLIPATNYNYRIRTLGTGSVVSTPSNSILVITKVGIPVATTATNILATSFTANWQAAGGALEYRLDVSTNDNFSSFVSGYDNRVVSGISESVTGLVGTSFFYRVRAVNASGTSSNSNVISVTITALENEMLNQTIVVSPNPAKDRCMIDIQDLTIQPSRVEIYDLQGKLMSDHEITRESQQLSFDISTFPHGIYIIQISSKAGIIRKKLVKIL